MMEFNLEKLKAYIVQSAILPFTDFTTVFWAGSKNWLSWKEYFNKNIYAVPRF